jgi:hypothetical protein
MSTIYYDSELKENEKYTVQDIKKLRSSEKYIGHVVQFRYMNGLTAHVRWTNNMHTLPARALIKVPGYVASTVHSKNAHAFAVIGQNSLGLPVGRVYIGPTGVTETHAIFSIDGKELKIPLDILASMVKVKEKITKEVKKTLKKTEDSARLGQFIEILDNPEAREPIGEVPAMVQKLFPDVTLAEITDVVNKEEGLWSDYDNNPHLSMEEADRANVIIKDKRIAAKFGKMAEIKVQKAFAETRNEVLEKRKKK